MTSSLLRALACAFLSLAAATASGDGAAVSPEAQEVSDESLRNAESLGLRLYRHDRAAALATDTLLMERKFRKDKHVGGWLTEAREQSVLVSFADKTAEPPAIRWQAEVADAGLVKTRIEAFDPPRAMTTAELGAWRARQLALEQSFQACSPTYNSVVLPSTATQGAGWSVFLLPATKDQRVLPFGGAYRFEISADGRTVHGSRSYTRSCIAFPRNPPTPKGSKPVAQYVTHLLDPAPTEVHVLLNLVAGQPLYVLTAANRVTWRIEQGRISRVGDAAGAAATGAIEQSR